MPDEEGSSTDTDYEYMPAIRMVMLYSNLNYHQVLDLPTDIFLQMLKNYKVEQYQQTEEGRAYLAKCERLNTTDFDESGITGILGILGSD